MVFCNQCSKEVSSEMALLTQDLDTAPLAFCSAICHESWFRNRLLLVPTADGSKE
jgi:hypothetical protein